MLELLQLDSWFYHQRIIVEVLRFSVSENCLRMIQLHIHDYVKINK